MTNCKNSLKINCSKIDLLKLAIISVRRTITIFLHIEVIFRYIKWVFQLFYVISSFLKHIISIRNTEFGNRKNEWILLKPVKLSTFKQWIFSKFSHYFIILSFVMYLAIILSSNYLTTDTPSKIDHILSHSHFIIVTCFWIWNEMDILVEAPIPK